MSTESSSAKKAAKKAEKKALAAKEKAMAEKPVEEVVEKEEAGCTKIYELGQELPIYLM